MGIRKSLQFVAGASAIVLLALAGCSSSTAPSVSNGSVAGSSVQIPVLITDAPNDQLVSFSLTLNSMVLTNSSGKTVNLLSSPATIEVTHLNGIQAPLVTSTIPADTYVSATMTYSNAQVTYIDPTTHQPVVANTVLANSSMTYTMPSPVTLNNSNTSLLVDLMAERSIAISGTTVTVTPQFMMKPLMAGGMMPRQGDDETGMEAHGAVVSASGSTLVIQTMMGSNISFNVNSSTNYQNVSGLSGLTAGALVEVDFTVQSGNVLLANRVELKVGPNTMGGGMMGGGMMASILRGPVTSTASGSFTMTLIEPMGTMASSASVGKSFTVTTTSSTVFALTPQFSSMSGLPFTPTFSAATLMPGQAVAVQASTGSATAGTATADKVYLVPQTLGGTVSAITTGSGYTAYTLTLPAGSAFGTLTGATSITVYSTSATIGLSTNAIAVGSTARFNGLVFKTASGYAMVAGCSPDGAPGR